MEEIDNNLAKIKDEATKGNRIGTLELTYSRPEDYKKMGVYLRGYHSRDDLRYYYPNYRWDLDTPPH